MTKFRDKLYPLTDFTSREANEVIDTVDEFASIQKEKYGTRQFFCADEFYLKAERDMLIQESDKD